MRILTLSTVLWMLLGTPMAFAQDDMDDTDAEESMEEEDDDAPIEMNKPTHEDPGPAPSMSGESETARQGKKMGAELGAGFLIGAVPGTQLMPYYNVMPNLSVGLLYGSGSFDFTSAVGSTSFAKFNKAELNASVLMVHGRYFFGNSFYMNAGLGQRNISANFDVKSTIADYGIKNDVEANSMSVLIGIGNQWQWDSGFSLGVEWIGYIVPLSSSSSDSVTEYGSDKDTVAGDTKESVAKLEKDSKELADLLGKLSTPRTLMLSIGWAF